VYISYKKYDLDGKALQPSAVIRQLENLFLRLEAKNVREKNSAADIWNEATAFEIYAANRRVESKSEFIASLKEYLLAEPKLAGRTGHLDGKFVPERFHIADREIAQRLIGKKLRLAPSNMERYFTCRFKYFCYDCLRLKKKRKAEMSPLETGTLIHHVLENILQEYQPAVLVSLEKQELEKVLMLKKLLS
jgi:ATP-dependent helicase/nuclease subunit B